MGYIRPLFTFTFSDDRLFPRSTRLLTKGSFEDVPDVAQDAVQTVDIDLVGLRTSFFFNDFAASLQYQWRWSELRRTSIYKHREKRNRTLNTLEQLPMLILPIEHTTRQRHAVHVVFSPKTHSWHVSTEPATTKTGEVFHKVCTAKQVKLPITHFTPSEVITNLEATQS